MQRLLVSVRGKKEALAAGKGGAHIADVEYPASALGTPYPLNVWSVRQVLPDRILVSTNIGELQLNHGTACQAAIGVAIAGADIVKAGLARMKSDEAAYLARSIVRSVDVFASSRRVVLVFFADPLLVHKYVDPVDAGPEIGSESGAAGVLIDTFDKSLGKGLLDYVTLARLRKFAAKCHRARLEAWVAGSITYSQMRPIWATGVDVVCVRQAACEPVEGNRRFGKVTSPRVRRLAATMSAMD